MTNQVPDSELLKIVNIPIAVPQNQRMTEVGRHLLRSPHPVPLLRAGLVRSRLHRTMSN